MDHAGAAARSQPVLDSIDTAKLLSEFQNFKRLANTVRLRFDIGFTEQKNLRYGE